MPTGESDRVCARLDRGEMEGVSRGSGVSWRIINDPARDIDDLKENLRHLLLHDEGFWGEFELEDADSHAKAAIMFWKLLCFDERKGCDAMAKFSLLMLSWTNPWQDYSTDPAGYVALEQAMMPDLTTIFREFIRFDRNGHVRILKAFATKSRGDGDETVAQHVRDVAQGLHRCFLTQWDAFNEFSNIEHWPDSEGHKVVALRDSAQVTHWVTRLKTLLQANQLWRQEWPA